MSTDLAMQIFLRPFFMVAMLFTAFVLAAVLRRYIPEGRVKNALYKRYSLIGPAENRTVMWTARAIVVLVILLIAFKPFAYI